MLGLGWCHVRNNRMLFTAYLLQALEFVRNNDFHSKRTNRFPRYLGNMLNIPD